MGRRRRAGGARSGWAGATIAVLALSSCAAGPLVPTDDGFAHRRHGYHIGLPPGAGERWQRVEVEGAILAWRGTGSLRMTLTSRCKQPLTRTEVLARHLRIGIPDHTVPTAIVAQLGQPLLSTSANRSEQDAITDREGTLYGQLSPCFDTEFLTQVVERSRYTQRRRGHDHAAS